jgi:hypothetical protein
MFVLMSVIGSKAQENCALTNTKSLFGLSLKMSPAQAKSVLGKNLKIKNKSKGEYIFFQNYIENPAPDSLTGVRAIYLRFFDGGLYQIEVFYEKQNNWQTLADFINSQSAKLGLPVSVWQTENNIARADCGEVSLVADIILNPHLELSDETVRAKVEEIRQKNKNE